MSFPAKSALRYVWTQGAYELGDGYYRKEDGNKTTLQSMRYLLLEKRNFTMEVDSRGDFILTLPDSAGNDLEKRVAQISN